MIVKNLPHFSPSVLRKHIRWCIESRREREYLRDVKSLHVRSTTEIRDSAFKRYPRYPQTGTLFPICAVSNHFKLKVPYPPQNGQFLLTIGRVMWILDVQAKDSSDLTWTACDISLILSIAFATLDRARKEGWARFRLNPTAISLCRATAGVA
jgi:hypothetical protein